MASCKRQQCIIDRLGFRQELDSWRHKLIHCVGFESILEGLFGQELIEDLKLFKDLEPIAVSDWSFDENCLFCCLQRDKVKEHLIGLNEGFEDTTKPLLVKDQISINRLEKQAEEFLSAVLSRNDVPNFSDPHIPVVAREILQRMIRQFAAEYTSKASSPQDSPSDSQHSDQSLPTPPLLSGAPPPPTSPAATVAGPAHNQNPVLSKLLMADQDAPLDLTIKKYLAEPKEQDGVLDLSIKKNRNSSSLPVHSSCLSPATSMLKGESPDLRVAKSKDLQSTSTLEQFMAKLCPHHQRQIVDAISFLQTEVKALSNTPKASTGVQETACSAVKSGTVTPEKSCPERIPSESTPKSGVPDVSHSIPSSNTKQGPGNAVSLKTSVPGSPALDLRSPGSGSYQVLVTPSGSPKDADNNRHSDHAPLKMKILTSNTDGKKLACVLNASLCAQSDTLEVRESISNSSNRTDTQSARLSSSVKRHNQIGQTHETMQSETPKHAKDSPAKVVHVTIPSDSVRTARKTARASSEQRTRDSTVFRGMVDPDLGHCDIVFIDKPITECFKEKRRGMQPRRNARKSTRGHMYSDEVWELKTVRTLAGRGNCPNPMPELITLVTPKQTLSKHEGVPPVDMPFAGACRETMNQQTPTEETGDSVMPETGDIVEVAASKVDVIVETSQTDQCKSNGKSCPPSPLTCPAVNIESVSNIEVEEDAVADSGITAEGEEIAGQASLEAVRNNEPEHQQDPHENTEQMMSETVVEPLDDVTIEDAEPKLPSDEQHNNEVVHLQNSASLLVNQVEEKMEEDKREELQDEQPEDPQIQNDLTEVTEKANITGTQEELVVKETEIKTSEADDSVMSLETEGSSDDVSSKTLEMLLKELPPWRTKKGSQNLQTKWCRQTETVVGYFNGRPILSSDRSLRRRANNSNMSPGKTTVKCSLNAPNSTSVDPVAESKSSENLPETNIPVKSKEATSVVQQVTESSSDTPSSPVSKIHSRTKLIQKQKRVQDSLSPLSDQPVDCPRNTESKRQLRSARQNVSVTPVTPPTSDAGSSISSPKHTTTAILPSTIEEVPALAFSYSLPITTSPQVRSPEPTVSEQPQQNMVPETVELNVENTQSPDLTPDETQKKEVDVRLQAKQRLRSSKVLGDDSRDEKQQPSSESTCPVESISTVKTEMQTQIMPLRNKRVPRKEAESEASEVTLQQKSNVASLEDRSANGDDSSSSISDRPTRMPLRRESVKAEMSLQAVTQSPPVDNKKLALRSQRLAGPSTSALTVATRQNDNTSPVRIMPERMTKSQVRSPSVPVASVSHSSPTPTMTPRQEPKQTTNRFFETLTGEESQQLITNLNIKYDKMQKGWVQMDKEGQPAVKYRNKSDRQAAIWKSKRRARKPKSVEHQKYSPVQMLFMKGFDLSSICRWFLESTETKSLVIVKKLNTRLPSETQLCFHSSSSSSATSQGVFPSLQAERLKKHLKKFAIASPVKSNPKSQKLIARALEQEANPVKGKERGEIPNATQTLAKSYTSRKASAQIGESQKTSGKSRNPASARILRKYSNIREKMQVHQTTKRLKEASKILKTNNMKRLATTKPVAKSNLRPALKERKSAPPVSKQIKTSATKMEKRKTMAEKKSANHTVQGRTVKAQSSSKASNVTRKNELPKRSSQRLGSLKISEQNPADSPKSKVDSKKHIEAEKVEVDKPAVTKVNSGESVGEIPHQSMEAKAPTSHDQVLTRSQRKMEAAVPVSGSPSHASKKTTRALKTQTASAKLVTNTSEPTMTRSAALKAPAKRRQAALLPRSAAKSARKRAQELSETPAKRTRTSLAK
ncbi:titin isoform X1 [Parambassis ranga]|uniref:Titin isoform X1 n=1 Tax=Parambassis ranga TaxID=210632 RepID=A0A6P7JP05_9TELE|nr:titin-like isoform X1 [Parambassis ranga]